MILITSFGEFYRIYIFLVFSMYLILFHFILFLSNFSPFGKVVFFFLFGVFFVLAAGGQFQWVRDS